MVGLKLWVIALAIAQRSDAAVTAVGLSFELRLGRTTSGLRSTLVGVGDAEPGDHLAQLLPGGDVGDADFAELLEVEQGQALGEQLAVDDALAEARDDPEADAAGELVERGADALQIVRFDVLEAVAQHDPVDALAGLPWRAAVRLFQISSA